MSSFIAAGSVTADGQFGCGESNDQPLFSVSKVGTGEYLIHLATALKTAPVIMVTGIYYQNNDASSDNIFSVKLDFTQGAFDTFYVKSMDLYNTAEGKFQYQPQDAAFYFTVFQSNT